MGCVRTIALRNICAAASALSTSCKLDEYNTIMKLINKMKDLLETRRVNRRGQKLIKLKKVGGTKKLV